MGEIAVDLADHVIVTTDDPHSESPEQIAEEIVKGIREKYTIMIDRRQAIQKALSIAKKGDTVLIAGRGHEKFQDFNGKKIAIDDREVVREIINVQYPMEKRQT